MKLENQVCSPELSEKLKSLGVSQKSLFYWWKYGDNPVLAIKTSNDQAIRSIENFDYFTTAGHKDYEYCSAFTVAELGEMLPLMIKDGYLELGNDSYGWFCVYREEEADWDTKDVVGIIRDENEANARAKMLIYLLENKLINL